MIEWVTGADAASHLIIFGVFVALLGGFVIGVLKGWRALIDQMREVLKEHESKEEAWQREVVKRLDGLERQVTMVREHLIRANIIEVSNSYKLKGGD
jgi:hypothetical protein